ncbi:potassium channel family protein [Abditibacterium utsteinense]|uniref:potassium channel family protein n=1 Tax=Abditibacterium utsteinense TaxID=1960156 RepID=UPI00147393A9|nr:potassium channel protein [Abditibacterium utsteinense]
MNSKQPGAHRGISDDNIERLRDAFFDIWRSLRAVFPATAFFALIILISTLGYILLGWPPFDAFYMVIITVFSVGYGEIQPVDTHAERIWTILVIFGGWSAVIITLGGITKAVTAGELRHTTEILRLQRAMKHLHDHVIICGYGRMGQTLARELFEAGVPFVVIDRDEERVAQVRTDGFHAHRGDATDEAALEFVGIARAKTLATVLPADAVNVFITLTARNLSREINIIARGEQPSTEKKLRQAGADDVILPATIGGLRIAHSIIAPEVGELVKSGQNLDWHSLGVEIDELLLHEHAHLIGKSVREIQKMGEGELMILGVRRGQEIQREEIEDLVLREGDAFIAISRTRHLLDIIGRDVEQTELI